MKIFNKIIEWLDDFYCWIIPYNYRWRHLYYKYWKHRNHCIIIPRYTERYGWCDKVELLPDLMFTLLDNFVTEECVPELVDWEASGHFVEVNGDKINVRKEMDNILTWWHHEYNTRYPYESDRLWKEIEKCKGETHFNPYFTLKFPTPEDEKRHAELFQQLHELENKMNKELNEYMHRLVNLRQYLWT